MNLNSQAYASLELAEEVTAVKQNDVVETSVYVSLLRKCTYLKCLEQGKRVCAHIAKNSERFVATDGQGRLRFLKNLAVEMYGRCGEVEEARAVFDTIQNCNEYSWTMIISAYAQNGHLHEALELFRKMHLHGMLADKFTFSIALTVCCELGDVAEGRKLHEWACSCGLDTDIVVATTLINLYGKCGVLETARELFDMIGHGNRDMHCWNSMITAYAQHGHSRQAFELYHRMDLEGIQPMEATFVSVLGACRNASIGKTVYERVRSSVLGSNVVVATAVISMYGRFGKVVEAREVFERMWDKQAVVPWTVIIGVYVQNLCRNEAFLLFRYMQLEGVKADYVTFVSMAGACERLSDANAIHYLVVSAGYERYIPVANSLVSMYGKCGDLEGAREVFNKVSSYAMLISWNAMMKAYAQNGHNNEVLELFYKMENVVKPDVITMTTVLDACASLGALERGKEIYTLFSALDNILVKTSVINLYGKCGRVADARQIFDNIVAKDTVAWNAMVAVYGHNGLRGDAVVLYYDMVNEGLSPNESSFLSFLFSVCHGGKCIQECVLNFSRAFDDYGIVPGVEHYACMVDLLARAGWLNEAEDLFVGMPFLATEAVCMSLLNACRVHGDFLRAVRVVERSFQVRGLVKNAQGLVMLSNIYSASWENLEDAICKLGKL